MQISVGISAYNEEKNIGRLLIRLLKENFCFSLKEIIIVASGCTDKTEEIIKEFAKKNKKIKLITEKERKGKASAINIILRKAKGDIIVFIDGDDLPERNSINKLIKPIEKNNISVTTGRMIPKISDLKLIDFLNYFIWNLHHRISLYQPKISGQFFAIKNNLIKNIYEKIVCDDAFVEGILRKRNIKTVYVPEALICIRTPPTISKFLKYRRRIATGYIQLKLMNLDASFSISQLIKALIKEITKDPKNIHKITFCVFLEVLGNILAFYDILRNYTPYCWER